jgi:hypothetical protein
VHKDKGKPLKAQDIMPKRNIMPQGRIVLRATVHRAEAALARTALVRVMRCAVNGDRIRRPPRKHNPGDRRVLKMHSRAS